MPAGQKGLSAAAERGIGAASMSRRHFTHKKRKTAAEPEWDEGIELQDLRQRVSEMEERETALGTAINTAGVPNMMVKGERRRLAIALFEGNYQATVTLLGRWRRTAASRRHRCRHRALLSLQVVLSPRRQGCSMLPISPPHSSSPSLRSSLVRSPRVTQP